MAQVYTQNGWVAGGPPAISAQRLNAMESGIFLASAPIVTTLPTTPVDGQECNYLADATNGVVWHLVYRSALGKWLYTGGPPLVAEMSSGASVSAASGWTTMTTDAQVTVPVSGDYDVFMQILPDFRDTGANDLLLAPALNGVPQNASVNVAETYMTAQPGALDIEMSRTWRMTGIPAGGVLKPSYNNTQLRPTMFRYRPIVRVTPVKVG